MNLSFQKSFDSQADGKELRNRASTIIVVQRAAEKAFGDQRRYVEPTLILPRLGQGSFPLIITDLYRRRCASPTRQCCMFLKQHHIKLYGEGSHAHQLFPNSARCSTYHSVAYRAVLSQYGYSNEKMAGNANAILIADVLGLPEHTQFTEHFALSKRSYGAVLKGAIRRFLYSEDDAPLARHFPRIGRLAALDRNQFERNLLTSERSWRCYRDGLDQVSMARCGNCHNQTSRPSWRPHLELIG